MCVNQVVVVLYYNHLSISSTITNHYRTHAWACLWRMCSPCAQFGLRKISCQRLRSILLAKPSPRLSLSTWSRYVCRKDYFINNEEQVFFRPKNAFFLFLPGERVLPHRCCDYGRSGESLPEQFIQSGWNPTLNSRYMQTFLLTKTIETSRNSNEFIAIMGIV